MSNFVVSARKYRPQTFDEVVGQRHVSETLKKALQSDQLAHAYLFCGPRGVGKTTCARILAKVANCKNVENGHTACGECSSCKAFEANASFNILELDAASNNSVDNIRTLIEQVRIRPQEGTHKVFIIDEVHMLSQSAFNAFLKTLEEPPPYVIFIMATTEKHKILPTILSRCQIYDFKRIQPSDIVPQLEYICQKEGKSADKDALHIIAEKADGAMRDALSIFDRIASSSGEHIDYKDVVSNLNILDYDYFFKATDYIISGQLDQLLLSLDNILHAGFEADQFIFGLSEHFRSLMVLKFPNTEKLLDVGDKLKERYLSQAKLIPLNALLSFLNIINDCDVQFPSAHNKRLHTEIYLSKMVYANQLSQSSDFESKKKITSTTNPSETKSSDPIPSDVEVSKEQKQAAAKPTQAIENTTTNTKESDKEKISEHVSIPKVEVIKDEQTAEIAKTTDLTSEAMAIKNIGKNILSPKALQEKIAAIKKEKEDKEANRIEVNVDTIHEVIQDYAQNVESKSLKQTLSIVRPEVQEGKIFLYVPSVIAKEGVQQQELLLNALRETFMRPSLSIHVVQDETKFPDFKAPKIKKALTPKDKYIEMVKKNPIIAKLQAEFDLNA